MNKIGRRITGVLALSFAIVLFVLSLNTFKLKIDPYYESRAGYVLYGADAYTGIQNATVDTERAAAATARRVAQVNNTISYVGGSLLLVGFFAFFSYFVYALASEFEEIKKSKEEASKQQTTLCSHEYKKCPSCDAMVIVGEPCPLCGAQVV